MSDLILLAALLDGPKHGWALKKIAGFVFGSAEMHNNLVYPLMRKFVAFGWVRRRSEPGERGRARAVYSLTLNGKRRLMSRLKQFGEKEAASASAFRVRVGLFGLLDPGDRARILAARERYLASRYFHFTEMRRDLAEMKASEWGHEVVSFLREEVRGERSWIRGLARSASHAPTLNVVERR